MRLAQLGRKPISIASSGLHRIQHLAWRRMSLGRLREGAGSEGEIDKMLFQDLLGPNPTIVEVGAHVGTDSEQFALLFSGADIHCIEAHPRNFRTLLTRTQWYPNVTVTCAAMSDERGVGMFFPNVGPLPASGSLLSPSRHLEVMPEIEFRDNEKFAVPLIRLDDYVACWGIDEISLLWLDVQGAELRVLNGATDSLAKTSHIYCEVSPLPLYQGGTTYSEVSDYLAIHGFKPQLEFLPSDWPYGNVLFSRTSEV